MSEINPEIKPEIKTETNSEIKTEINIQNEELPIKNDNENITKATNQTKKKKKDVPNTNTNPNPNQNEAYQSLHLKKKPKKKISLFSKLKITVEFSFLILTFILTFKKAINVVMRNRRSYPEETSNKLYIHPRNRTTFKREQKEIKICLCTLTRKDNKYIKEFSKFYEEYGVDKIFLYDNNDKNEEKLDEIIKDYIDKGFIEILDWRGKKNEAINMMKDCYQKNNKEYNWLMFYDVDDYIHLNKYSNIKTFLNDQKFNNCKSIYLNRIFHTDNNLLHYDNRTLQERFPVKEKIPEKNGKNNFNYIKSIIRGNLNNLEIVNKYSLTNEIKGCNGFGKEADLIGLNMKEVDFENYYIDSYFYKSIDEFIEKLKSEDYDQKLKNEIIRRYFELNGFEYKKISYFEKNTGINVSIYHNGLNINNKTNKKQEKKQEAQKDLKNEKKSNLKNEKKRDKKN